MTGQVPNKVKIDTIYIGVYDSSMVVTGETQQLIIIQDKQTPKEVDFDWFGSLMIPIVILFAAGFITYIFGWRRMKSTIKNLESNSIKSDTEVSKLKSETEQIKKSFQPVVVGTIQAVRDKLVDKKINALKKLAEHNSQFMQADEQFYAPDGEPIFDSSYYYDSMFKNYSHSKFNQLKKYKNEFSYFLGEESYNIFQVLFQRIDDMVTTRDSYYREEVDQEPGMEDDIKRIIQIFEDLSKSLRKELHLDNSYIEDFIAANQLNNNTDIT